MAASVRSLPEAKAEDADNPLADKQKAQAETVETVEVEFESRQQISKVLRRNKCKNIVISVPDVVDMIAALNQIAKLCYKARFLEVECHEQRQQLEGDLGALLVFRVRLDALYDAEVAKLKKREELNASFRNKLVNALPEDLVNAKGDKLKKMVQISWIQPGSIVLGGVAALSLVVLIVSAIGMTRCTCDCCTCLTLCSCMRRANRSDSDLYFCALSELQKRGATFDVLPDGSSRLHVPPVQEYVLCSTM
eukprot:s5322_g2.t1